MIYGVFSDIHGNLEAFYAALQRMKDEGAQKYIFCGDLIGYGPDPEKCIQKYRNMQAEGLVTGVLGNHDAIFTHPELREYVIKQRARGSGNVKPFDVEYHKRFATPFASFILTAIGLSLSARKRKGGMGLYLGIGLALSASYILLQSISSTFAINADWHPMIAVWFPNILFTIIAFILYKKAPQ